MAITLIFTTVDGKKKQVAYERDVEAINLSKMQIESIDLTPLQSCAGLQELDLSHNQLQSIDLLPLLPCTTLERLDLGYNQLRSINLVPLRFCTGLRWISLIAIDLQYIDVTPLFRINDIEVGSDHSPTSWLRPVSPYLVGRAFYSRPNPCYSWDFLYGVAEQFRNDYRVQHDILVALGLADYGFIDCNLIDVFLSISPETSTEDAREILIKTLVEEITTTVDRGGPITGLNLEVVRRHTDIALRTNRIIELRKMEMELVVVAVNHIIDSPHYHVDMREFCLSAYGYEIVYAMPYLDLIVPSFLMSDVLETLEELGFQLKMDTQASSGVIMSDELKMCIWLILENVDRRWTEVDMFCYLDRFLSQAIMIILQKEGGLINKEDLTQRIESLDPTARERVDYLLEKLFRSGLIYNPRVGMIRLLGF